MGEEPSIGLSYGLSAMQGWRAQMEDDHVQILGLPDVRAASARARQRAQAVHRPRASRLRGAAVPTPATASVTVCVARLFLAAS